MKLYRLDRGGDINLEVEIRVYNTRTRRCRTSLYLALAEIKQDALKLIRINLVYNRFLAGYITSVSIRFNSDRFNELSDVVLSLHTLDGRCATNKYFQIIGSIHDIESYFGIDNTPSSYVQIFFCHWAHKAIIFVWVSRNLFHIAWNGNYELWEQNPIKTIPIAHGICDPHFGLSNIRNKIAYNGIYNWLYTLGFDSVFKHLYNFVITDELLAVISIPLALIHLIYLDSFTYLVASYFHVICNSAPLMAVHLSSLRASFPPYGGFRK